MKNKNITQSIVELKTIREILCQLLTELSTCLKEEEYEIACFLRDELKVKNAEIDKHKSIINRHLSYLKSFDIDYIFERKFLINILMNHEKPKDLNEKKISFEFDNEKDLYPQHPLHEITDYHLEREKRTKWYKFLKIRKSRIENNLNNIEKEHKLELDLINKILGNRNYSRQENPFK